MSHTGRCFRQARRTRERKEKQGVEWVTPIRYKVPARLMPFLANAFKNQRRAQVETMGRAIVGFNKHQALVGGKGRAVINGGDQVQGGPA